MFRYISLFFIVLIPVMSGCALLGGGSTPDIPRAKGYQVVVPPSWKQQSAEGESDTAYSNTKGSIATLTSSCTSTAKFNQDILTKQLLMGARKVKYKEKRKVAVDGQEGQYSNVQASLDNKPFYLLLFVLQKNNCVFDFTLVSPKPFDALEQEEFTSFFMSFKYGTN